MHTLIIGATGNIGQQLTPLLANNHHLVAAASRNVEKAKDLFGLPNINYRTFDFNDNSTWDTALKGVDKIFLVVPPNSTTDEQQQAFFQKAKAMGVQHIIYSSGRTTAPIPDSPLNRTERFIKNSGIPWTILRPGWFMQNFFNWYGNIIKADNALYLPADDAKTAFIDTRDIAAVAMEVLSHPAPHTGKMYNLTSDEAIDHQAVASHISNAAGRSIRYVALSDAGFIEKMMEKGWPQKKAEKIAWLMGFVKAGEEVEVSPDVANILGRQAIGFGQFAMDHADKWT